MPSKRGSERRWSLLTLLILLPVIYLRVAAPTHQPALGLAAVAARVALLIGLIVYARRRALRQLDEMTSAHSFRMEASLAFECLPGEWPTKARETLNPMGANNTPALPVVLSASDSKLCIDKKLGVMIGRTPFHAEVPLAGIAEVRVAPPFRAIVGSSLVVELHDGSEVLCETALNEESARIAADLLRRAVRNASSASWERSGLVVTSDDPPLRTSFGRAWLLMMACFLPFLPAMFWAHDGGAAAFAATATLMYSVWLMMRRLPTLHRRLAFALAVTACAFVVDALSTGQPVRLAAAVLSLGLAARFVTLPNPQR
jgi:hypothetical protein